MPVFTLTIRTDNAAYCDDDGEPIPASELALNLRTVADRIEQGDTFDTFRNISDSNGNIVGTFALKPDDYR
jgi:hypothetical protein